MTNLVVLNTRSRAANVAAPTMSSREIAELTGSTHDNVLKTIRLLMKRGVVSGNETTYIHSQNGQSYTEYQLDFRNTMVVVSGYSPELRARIIDRWQELEARQAQPVLQLPDFTQPAVAARAWADQFERALLAEQVVHQLAAENQTMAPKVAAFDALCDLEGTVNLTNAGKILDTGGKRLKQALVHRGHLTLGGIPYQRLLDNGRFVVKTVMANGHMRNQPRITAKGMAWLAKNKVVLLSLIDELAPARRKKAA